MGFVAAAGAPWFSVFAANFFFWFSFGGWCDRCAALTSFKLNTLFVIFLRFLTRRSDEEEQQFFDKGRDFGVLAIKAKSYGGTSEGSCSPESSCSNCDTASEY
jgi:hypothetical protein